MKRKKMNKNDCGIFNWNENKQCEWRVPFCSRLIDISVCDCDYLISQICKMWGVRMIAFVVFVCVCVREIDSVTNEIKTEPTKGKREIEIDIHWVMEKHLYNWKIWTVGADAMMKCSQESIATVGFFKLFSCYTLPNGAAMNKTTRLQIFGGQKGG